MPSAPTADRSLRLRSLAGSTTLHVVCIAAATLGGWRQLAKADWRAAHAAPMTATVTLEGPPIPTPQPQLPVPTVQPEASPEALTCSEPPAPPIEAAAEDQAQEQAQEQAHPTAQSNPTAATGAAWLTPVRAAAAAPPPPQAPTTAAPTVADVSSVQPSPLPGQNEPPRYPWVAWRKGIEGTVTVGLDIDCGGAVIAARLVESSGCHQLDDAALTQLRTWRFPPAALPGAGMRSSRQTVVFRLRG